MRASTPTLGGGETETKIVSKENVALANLRDPPKLVSSRPQQGKTFCLEDVLVKSPLTTVDEAPIGLVKKFLVEFCKFTRLGLGDGIEERLEGGGV